jgi:uncharacterized protein
MDVRVLFHLDSEEDETFGLALENIKNLLKETPPGKSSVYLVVNGKAVKLLLKDKIANHTPMVDELCRAGVRFSACGNSLARHGIDASDIPDLWEICPAGILLIIRLQHNGYAYVKP